MLSDQIHPTREELLLFLDREMTVDQVLRTEMHLLQCEDCSATLKEMISTLNRFDAVYRADTFQAPSEIDQRAALQIRLRAETKPRNQTWRLSSMQQPMTMIYAAAAVLIAALGISWAHHHAMQQWPTLVEDRPVPNPELTPGAVRAVKIAEICPAKDEDKDPAVPAELQQTVFEEYGVAKSTRGREFQVDYLINPQLGGTGEIRNLWPQPYQSTVWNAHAKDALEDRLHTMVCERQIDLAEAQREIATDWISAYKRHFHTETPLRETPRLAENASIEHTKLF